MESKFTCRTARGDSAEKCQHDDESPIHGTGQGSCASPAMWLLISSFIMDLLEENANGMELHNVDFRARII
jgi:hypothetical protein